MSRLREELNAYLSVPGALCCVAGGWLWLAAAHCNEEARRVAQAYVLDALSDARKLDKLLPMLVALRGRVESGDPKKCELSDRRCVIHEVHEEDILLVKGPSGAPERKPFDTRHETTEREWHLEDDSRTAIKVMRGREASQGELASVLEVAQEYHERREGHQSAMQTVSQIITGGRYQGHKRTEKFLPVGAVVTVVGELARNTVAAGGGAALRYLLRPPSPDGRPFVITNKTIAELHTSLAARARAYRRLALCLGGVGAFLVLRKVARQAWLRHKERQARERVRKALAQHAAAAAAGGGAAAGDVEAGGGGAGAGDRDAGVCVVCLSAPSEMVYTRCGHMCCCGRCATALAAKRCPVCRAEGPAIKVFRT
ncbi:SP1 [Scenedesmus sp. PABB004]|nr:SP1 [Scenedesmus sp. PABB004]